jgi:flagellar basal body P-ring protein FlgI
MSRHWTLGTAVLILGVAMTFYSFGCGTSGQTTWLGHGAKHLEKAESATLDDEPKKESAAIRDTVQTATWLEGLRKMSVGGYGIVVGLGKNGTRQCPRPIREYMLKEMRGRYRLGGEYEELKHLSPESLIDSEETAVVTVYGEIPAAVQKGVPFDLTVHALDGTDTRSLEGGWLMPCYLKLWSNGQPVEGRVLGEGAGPVFINPFALRENAATKVNPRQGRIIGGGRTNEARRIRLVLTEPSAAIASRLMYLINQRFGLEPYKTADAASPSTINLRVPPAWFDREQHFLDVLVHLYVPAAPSFPETRLKQLCDEAVKPDAQLDDISLAWEGLGKICLDSLRKLYTHKDYGVSYYAARAALRNGDDLALEVMARHVKDSKSPYREVAVEELGQATDVSRAVTMLRPLLDDDDRRIRHLAYEGLRRHDDALIKTLEVGKKSFAVDIVPTTSKMLISARRSGEQRITLFGSTLCCRTPVFYTHHSELLIISADPGAKSLKIVRRTPLTGRLSTPVQAPLDLVGLIQVLGRDPEKDARGHYEGLGLTYSQVVEVLHDLCASKTIDATFALQEVEKAEINASLHDSGRPESEL